MPNTAVSNLTLLAGADIAQTDNLYIVDVSAAAGSRGKKTTVQDLAFAIAGGSFQPSDPQLDSLAALTYSGNELKNVRVNAAGTGFELAATASGFDGSFSSLTSVPTTIAGYGITDAQPLDLTLTNLAAQNWALNSVPVGSGVDTIAQLNLGTNTVLGRSSTGNAAAKTVTDFAFTLLDDADAASMRTTLGVDAAGSSTLTAANEASDSTCFPLFATAATGTVTLKTNGSLIFNSATTNLGCTTFTGALVGNATTATTASAVAVGGITGLGTGVATALAVNVGSAGAFVTFNGSLGTPSSGTLTNCTFPTLNQNTTGSAASLSISGQTGLMTVTGLASTNRIKTVRDAADTILELGGSYTPTGTWTSLTLVTPALGTPASGVVTNLTGTASININGTVGATTPATGTFMTLVAGSTTSLLLGTAGSAVGNIGFRNATSGTATLAPPTGALGTYTVTLPNAASTLPIFGQQITFAGPTAARTYTLPDAAVTLADLTSTQTLSGKTLTTPIIATGGSINDENGNEQIKFVTTASAINDITITNAASGNAPTIAATGSSGANVNLLIVPKLAGQVRIGDGTDNTKLVYFVVSGATTAKATSLNFIQTVDRAITFPDATGTVVLDTSTNTLTSKRITKRTTVLANPGATVTINTDNQDLVSVTGQTADITAFSVSGTAVHGDVMEIQITGTASRGITWTGTYFANSTLTAPATTSGTTMLSTLWEYNSAQSKWLYAGGY